MRPLVATISNYSRCKTFCNEWLVHYRYPPNHRCRNERQGFNGAFLRGDFACPRRHGHVYQPTPPAHQRTVACRRKPVRPGSPRLRLAARHDSDGRNKPHLFRTCLCSGTALCPGRTFICEVGLGGRLDCANALDAGAAAIAQISLDHVHILDEQFENRARKIAIRAADAPLFEATATHY